MRKFFKKAVAFVASAAMMVGMVAGLGSTEAKAAMTKKVTFVLSDSTGVDDVYVQFTGENVSATITGSQVALPCWGGTQQAWKCTSEGSGKYSLELTIDEAVGNGKYCTLKFISVRGTDCVVGKDVATDSNADLFNGADEVYVTIDMVNDPSNWNSGYELLATDPTGITAADVMAKIDAIGTVTYTAESKAKIDAAQAAVNLYAGAASDITNMATLTAAVAKYNELKAADEASAAGTLVIYFKNSANWDTVKIYSWASTGTEFFGEWSGKALTACTENDGWFSAKFDITCPVSVITNNGNGEQTVDITNVRKGTYWLTLGEKNGEGKYTFNLSTTAPAGWVDEEANELELQAPMPPAPAPAPAPDTADTTPYVVVISAMLALGAAVVVLNAKKERM